MRSSKKSAPSEQISQEIKDLLANPEKLRTAIRTLAEHEQEIITEGVSHLREIANILTSNWHILVPALVLLGVRAFFSASHVNPAFSGQSKTINH